MIYDYHSERLPIFLLAAYVKNEKTNLSKAERNAIRKLVPILVKGYQTYFPAQNSVLGNRDQRR